MAALFLEVVVGRHPVVVDMGAYKRYEFCGDLSQSLKGDLNLDRTIDLLDFAIMVGY